MGDTDCLGGLRWFSWGYRVREEGSLVTGPSAALLGPLWQPSQRTQILQCVEAAQDAGQGFVTAPEHGEKALALRLNWVTCSAGAGEGGGGGVHPVWGRGCSPCHESLSMGVQALLEPIPFPGPLMAWASLVAQPWAPHMLLSSGTPEVCVS